MRNAIIGAVLFVAACGPMITRMGPNITVDGVVYETVESGVAIETVKGPIMDPNARLRYQVIVKGTKYPCPGDVNSCAAVVRAVLDGTYGKKTRRDRDKDRGYRPPAY